MPRLWEWKRSPFEKGFEDRYYDLFDDLPLIEASFAKQYGIRLSKTKMSYREFSLLLSGLMPDTPLGAVVAVRSEKNRKVIAAFTPEQRAIRTAWRLKRAQSLHGNTEYIKYLQGRFEAAWKK